MEKVVFITDKWCDGNPDLEFTNHHHNLFRTFEQFNTKYSYDIIHADEALLNYNNHIDNVIPNYYMKYGIDIAIFSLVNGMNFNPSLKTFQFLKDFDVKTCIIWPDTGPDWGLNTIKSLNPYVDLHVSWDNPVSTHPYYKNIYAQPREPNHINLWCPQDYSMFYCQQEKDIDVSLMGSIKKYSDRKSFLDSINQLGIKIWTGGGQREEKLTPHKYAEIIRRSKIGINFSLSQTGVFYQTKARVFEYIASGGLLLESDNPSILSFYNPNEDYVPFVSLDDLITKIKFYLANTDERLKISDHGNETYKSNWTGNHFWSRLLSELS